MLYLFGEQLLLFLLLLRVEAVGQLALSLALGGLLVAQGRLVGFRLQAVNSGGVNRV